MQTKVGEFYKTEHFLYRQWDRGITDVELTLALAKVCKPKGTQLLVVSR